MGLYDEPLPPRPPPVPKKEKPVEDEEDFIMVPEQRLFEFDSMGREVNGRLPRLGRRLDRGVECYYEASDRVVQSLVENTGVNVLDACWALEACKGDVTEAWTCISTARRMQLTSNNDDMDDLNVEDDFAELKAERKKDDMFSMGEPDQQWLPRQNPKPVDDEPWFTG